MKPNHCVKDPTGVDSLGGSLCGCLRHGPLKRAHLGTVHIPPKPAAAPFPFNVCAGRMPISTDTTIVRFRRRCERFEMKCRQKGQQVYNRSWFKLQNSNNADN